jgi:hypothetical protein
MTWRRERCARQNVTLEGVSFRADGFELQIRLRRARASHNVVLNVMYMHRRRRHLMHLIMSRLNATAEGGVASAFVSSLAFASSASARRRVGSSARR